MSRLTFNYQFNYRLLLGESEGRQTLTVPLPVIEVTLSHNGLTATDLALIDSGSTYSLFSREIAEELEIDVLQGRVQRLATLGGPMVAYGCEIEMKLYRIFVIAPRFYLPNIPFPVICLGISASLTISPWHYAAGLD